MGINSPPQYLDLNADQWHVVIDALRGNEDAMFVLRSWALCQSVSIHGIRAFRGITDPAELKNSCENATIRAVTQKVRTVLDADDGQCYIWNEVEKSWSTGFYNRQCLMTAFKRFGERGI